MGHIIVAKTYRISHLSNDGGRMNTNDGELIMSIKILCTEVSIGKLLRLGDIPRVSVNNCSALLRIS